MDKGIHKISIGNKIANGINYFLLFCLSASIILPFLNIIALSFNDGKDASLGGITFWPRVFSLSNYEEVFSNPDIIQGFKVSLFRTVIGTILSVLLTAMAAYALKKKDLPGRNYFTILIMFTMLFNGGIIPYYMVLKSLHLTNTLWVFVIPSLYSAWNIVLMRTFFESIDISLEESAKLDGANEFQVFFRVILPLSMPVISVICLFNAVAHWNDWFSGTFYVNDKDLYPLQTILRQMLNSAEAMRRNLMTAFNPNDPRLSVTGESLKMATILVSVLPIACVYPFIQKYFVQGLMVGSVKG